MGRIFDLESPVMRFLSLVGDLMILNLLMFLCCIPVITMGAAFTGMHYVLLKIVRGEEGYLVKGFFKSFKQNFRQATILWLLILLFLAVYIGDFLIFGYSGTEFPKALIAVILAVAVIFLMVSVYIFPMLARFENSIKNTVRNALFMAILNLPKTILMVLLLILPFVVFYFFPSAGIFVIMFGFSLPAYLSAFLYSKIFKKFEPEVEPATSDYEFSVSVDGENEGNNE